VDFGIPGEYVSRVFDHVARFFGPPKAIRANRGPEFTSRALDWWAYDKGVDLKLIAAGKPTQNACIESFNGKFRDQCLNDYCSSNLAHARAPIGAWRRDDNEARQRSSLGRVPPAELAARHRLRAGDGAHRETVWAFNLGLYELDPGSAEGGRAPRLRTSRCPRSQESNCRFTLHGTAVCPQ